MGFFDNINPFAFGNSKGKSIGKMAKKALQLQLQSKAGTLKKGVEEDETISERTRLEILQQMGVDSAINKGILGTGSLGAGSQSLGSLQDIFGKAKEGIEAKFKTRQKTQQFFNAMVDKPDSQRLRGGILNFGSSVRK
jgi:hypothetical protein